MKTAFDNARLLVNTDFMGHAAKSTTSVLKSSTFDNNPGARNM